jgi:putative copper export protein
MRRFAPGWCPGAQADSMRTAFTIFIGFLHDFAAGCWGATVLAVYWLQHMEQEKNLTGLLFGLKRRFFFIGLGCVVIVLAAGAGRMFTYASIGNVYGDNAETLRKRMLVIKHILLTTAFIAGISWQYSMVYK